MGRSKTSGFSHSPNIASSEMTETSQLGWPHQEVSPGLPAKLLASQAGKIIMF